MTRDEAKQRCASLLGAMDKGLPSDQRAALLVDGFICLGLLKLDEPATLADRIKGALKWGDNSYSMAMAMLSDAGLKIVEK